MENFGDKLKNLRHNLAKSQTDVANELTSRFPAMRISQATISALEQREAPPRGEVLEIFAQYYNVPLSYFYESAATPKLDAAKSYLRSLKGRSNQNAPIHAHSTDHRKNDDEIASSLSSFQEWQPDYDEDEYLDT